MSHQRMHATLVRRAESVFAGVDVCDAAGLDLAPDVARPMYDDDVWDLSGLSDAHRTVRRAELIWKFDRIINPAWRTVAKDIAVAVLAPRHDEVVALPFALRAQRSPRTVNHYVRQLTNWFNWLTDRGHESLTQVTQYDCDAYLRELSWSKPRDGSPRKPVGAQYVSAAVKAVQAPALYGQLLIDQYSPGFVPWNGSAPDAVAGVKRSKANSTAPVPDAVFQPLLANCLYLIDVIGPHLADCVPHVRAEAAAQRLLRDTPLSYRAFINVELERLAELLERWRQSRSPLPALDSRDQGKSTRLQRGWRADDPLLRVDINHVLAQAQVRHRKMSRFPDLGPMLEQAVADLGIAGRWLRDAPPVAHAITAEPVPWTGPLSLWELERLVVHVLGACLIVTSAVSGMRNSELAEIVAGCRSTSDVSGGGRRFRLAGKLIKGQRWGGVPDEWVVVEEVDRAVALAERLLDAPTGQPLFGKADVNLTVSILRRWFAGPAGQRLGLAPIPDGPVNARMLRRTLALELSRRPGGLLAAKIHLKHISVVTTEGYAARPGGSQALFHVDVQQAEHEHHLELTVAAFHDYRSGVMPAGPGARDLINLFHHVDAELGDPLAATEPTTLTNERRLENLLRRRAQTLHIGSANYCWFTDPSKALCLRLAGTPTAKRPLIGKCDSARCPQATHHAAHRPVWLDTARSVETFLGNPRVPKGEKPRLRIEYDRAMGVVAAIDDAARTSPASEDTV